MQAAFNHVSKYVPKNDYFYRHLQYKQTRSGVREGGGCIYIYVYVYICIYLIQNVEREPFEVNRRSKRAAGDAEGGGGSRPGLLGVYLN